MSEPRTRARSIDLVAPGLLHWTLRDDRIDARSDSHAVKQGQRTVLIEASTMDPRS